MENAVPSFRWATISRPIPMILASEEKNPGECVIWWQQNFLKNFLILPISGGRAVFYILGTKMTLLFVIIEVAS
jgi:hypothetical protein